MEKGGVLHTEENDDKIKGTLSMLTIPLIVGFLVAVCVDACETMKEG